MEIGKIKKVVIVGQIMMYGTLILSMHKNEKELCCIDVDYAPDGCSMVHDATIEIFQDKFMSLLQNIIRLLDQIVEKEDEGCSDCYVELMDENGTETVFNWPDDLHSETFIAIGEQVNSLIHNDVASDFFSMF